ncbi:proteasome endopeptidase complex, archaeal, beta subunit [Candidatus Altiarchaeales archaeon WOR_SM1_SCG]|nr:proteasome endopeptidase complex, archaeal, beta subunit [Candidatus Altiarchaeales archaeon WOR_SM1_SCG]
METKTLKGTTTIGLTCSDGIVFATDRRASMGYFIASKKAKKSFKINDFVGATVAGSVGDAESLMRLMQAEAKLYELNNGKVISGEAVATLLSNILHGNKMFPYLVQLLIGGYGENGNTNARVFSLDPIGGLTEEKMAATGSGSPMAYGVLEQEYSENKTVEENMQIALKALSSAMERDIATGNGMDLATITKDGFKQYSDEEIEVIYSRVKKK